MIPKNRAQDNIQLFQILFIPLIIASKVVRWVVMYAQLVAMSIGSGMVNAINSGREFHFAISGFSEMSNGASVIVQNTNALFSSINIFGFTTYVEWEVFFTIVFNLFFATEIITYYRKHPYAGLYENCFIYMALAILNIFCLNMSKEPLQLIFFIIIAKAISMNKTYQTKLIGLGVALVLSALLCRKYFLLCGMYLAVLQFSATFIFKKINIKTKNGKKRLYIRLFFLFVIIALVHYSMLSFLSTENEDLYKEMESANTRTTNANVTVDSQILPIFGGGNPVLLTLDFFIKIFRLSFPIELLAKGKFTYIFSIAYQALLAYFVVRAFIRRNEKSREDIEEEEWEEEGDDDTEDEMTEEIGLTDEEEEEDDEEVAFIHYESKDQQNTRTVAMWFYLSFLLCSAAFEPDFGSWMRHQGVAFPIFLLLL